MSDWQDMQQKPNTQLQNWIKTKQAKTRELNELFKTEQNRLAKLNALIDKLRLRKNVLFEPRKNQYNDSIVKIEAIGMQ